MYTAEAGVESMKFSILVLVSAMMISCSEKSGETDSESLDEAEGNDLEDTSVAEEESEETEEESEETEEDSTTDTGDDSTEETEEETEEEIIPPCSVLSETGNELLAANSIEEASQALVLPSSTDYWSVVEMGDQRFVMVEIDSWMATIDIYGSDNVTLTFDYVGLNAEMLTEQEPMTDCPGFHHQNRRFSILKIWKIRENHDV